MRLPFSAIVSPGPLWPGVAFLLGLAFGGCSVDYYAHALVEQNTTPGKAHIALGGTGEELVRQGRIDLHKEAPTPDGQIIDVWCIRARHRADYSFDASSGQPATVLVLHGLMDSKASYLDFGRLLSRKGYNVVLPDLRAHGRSTGKYVTFGAKEHRDVQTVVDAVLSEENFEAPVYVIGVSMGASVAIQYAAADPRCKGVLAVAPFKDLATAGKRYVPLMSPEKYEQVLARAGEMAGFDPAESSAIRAAAKLTCPLVLVHGKLDAVVPVAHSRAIYQAARCPKRFEDIAFASHATVLLGRAAWFARRLDMIATGQLGPAMSAGR